MAKHKAMMAVELEVMAKKMDRFGWDRDRGTAAHDRIMTDWMDTFADYPLAEVQAACRDWVVENPHKMPNEGHILSLIKRARVKTVAKFKATLPTADERPAPCSKDAASDIMQEVGFQPKKFGGLGE